ncbi:MAG: AMP-binding enzyme, partial [Pirellulaceae bacterium]
TLPAGQIGELVVSGDHVCRDYFRNPEANAENKIVDPLGVIWHRMGDTGYFDGEHRFWLTGRVHSTIRRDSELLHPQLIEQVVARALPKINQVAAVGMPDKQLGQALWIVVVGGSEQPPGIKDQVAAAVQESVYAQSCDRVLIRTDALPVDPRHNSKIDYAALTALLLEEYGG